jgi:Uma2 family endonuclease
MITVETLQPENRVLTTILHTLAEEGYLTVSVDEEEMSATTLHYKLIHYLFTALELFFKSRNDVFVASNLRISYDEKNPLKWIAPDILIAFGAEKHERSSYHLPTEKIMPQVVFEVASEQTADRDLGEKYLLYSKLGVEEYYLLDPDRSVLPKKMNAYHRQDGVLESIKVTQSKVFSPRLGLEVVDTGENFRLFDPNLSQFLPSVDELAARVAELEALLKQNSK